MPKKEKQNTEVRDFSKLNFARLAHNYLMQRKQGNYTLDELNQTIDFINFSLDPQNQNLPVHNVGVLLVCINQHYWPYALPVIQGLKNLFLPQHNTEIMMFSDLSQWPEAKNVTYGAHTIFPVDSLEWPYPTLYRYHMFLQQEEYLKKFDYLFYVDLDMRVVNVVGDELLGDGLTAAQHPMYAIRKELIPPYEPNPASTAFINRPGKIVERDGKPWFQPLYYAGGVQGGRTEQFIEAMKVMQRNIDADMNNGYIAIWNDESHWNKYLFDNPPSVVLDPSYVYPDSMIEQYYKKTWGRDYTPRIITLTKPFSLSKEGGTAANQMMQTM